MTDLVLEALRERDGTHVVVQGSGHAVHLHSPVLVAEAILGCAQ
jgi:pimeloyl-ACP methyl ester carboxylesterase